MCNQESGSFTSTVSYKLHLIRYYKYLVLLNKKNGVKIFIVFSMILSYHLSKMLHVV